MALYPIFLEFVISCACASYPYFFNQGSKSQLRFTLSVWYHEFLLLQIPTISIMKCILEHCLPII